MRVILADTKSVPSQEIDKEKIKAETKKIVEEIGTLQYKMQAEKKHSILIVLQGMDASGKDGIINKIFRKASPNGISVTSFKKPTEEEFDHDFLWRIHSKMPLKGHIKLFNRSHYEDILVPSVYKYIDAETIDKRYDHINNFESLIAASGTKVLKFYLNVSVEKQEERLKERIEIREKHFKHNDNDAKAVANRDKFEAVYERIFDKCSIIPWIIVPADYNWYKAYVVAKEVLNALRKMELEWPELDTEIYL